MDCAADHIHADLGLHANIDDLLSKLAVKNASDSARRGQPERLG